MSRTGPAGAPRHMAGTKRTAHPPVARPVALDATPAGDGTAEDAAPVAKVHRHRLAFAMSATVAALPILVLDNFPATADTGERTAVEAAAPSSLDDADPTTTTIVVERPASTTTSTMAPTTPDPVGAGDAEEALAASDDTAEGAEVATLRAPSSPAPARSAPAPTTTTAPPAPPTTAAPAPSSAGDPDDPATWDRLAQCESDGNWQANSGNGYYGGLQFSLATWRDVGGVGYPHEASRDEQIRRGKMLQARYGWGQWPYCSRELGYR